MTHLSKQSTSSTTKLFNHINQILSVTQLLRSETHNLELSLQNKVFKVNNGNPDT